MCDRSCWDEPPGAALSLPFLTLGMIWGAVDFSKFLAVFVVDVLAGMVASTIAMGLSGYFRRSLTSYLGTGAVMFLWLVVWPIFGMLSASLFHNGRGDQDSFVIYLFFAHHLGAPLFMLLVPTQEHPPYSAATIIPFALAVWFFIGAIFFRMACHGVSRPNSSKN